MTAKQNTHIFGIRGKKEEIWIKNSCGCVPSSVPQHLLRSWVFFLYIFLLIRSFFTLKIRIVYSYKVITAASVLQDTLTLQTAFIDCLALPHRADHQTVQQSLGDISLWPFFWRQEIKIKKTGRKKEHKVINCNHMWNVLFRHTLAHSLQFMCTGYAFVL